MIENCPYSTSPNGGFGVELPGFWVAKYPAGFQASTVDASGVLQNSDDTVQYSNLKYTEPGMEYTNVLGQALTAANITAAGDDVRLSYPVFKPLTYAYNAINIDSSFRIAREIKNATSFYGLQNADTHLMKNSEWGAVCGDTSDAGIFAYQQTSGAANGRYGFRIALFEY